jgi:hypothetical protein
VRLRLNRQGAGRSLGRGHTTKKIAARLNISPETAEAYRGELMNALEIHGIASLTRYAIRTGLVPRQLNPRPSMLDALFARLAPGFLLADPGFSPAANGESIAETRAAGL